MKHSHSCLSFVSNNCTCKNSSPYEMARELLKDVYNNARLMPDGNLTLTPATYGEIKEFLISHRDDKPSV